MNLQFRRFRRLNWEKLAFKFGVILSYFVVFILIYLIILGFIIVNFGNGENTNFENPTNSWFNSKFEINSQKVEVFDTIIVLGAGLIDNSVSPVLKARIDHALDLYQKSVAKSIIFTGGIGQNQIISEGEASFNYAIEKLSQNSQSLELKTKPNFFFEKVSKTTKQNLVEAQQIMKENKLETAIIVSDPLHLFRTNQIANSLKMKVKTSPTIYSRYQTFDSKSGFLFRELFFCQVFWLTGS